MTEEIIIDGMDILNCEQAKSCDCCRCKNMAYYRLEQENKELKSDVLKWQKAFSRQYQINENKGYSKAEENYRSALEEIRKTIKNYDLTVDNGTSVDTLYTIRKIINEVLQCE